MTTPEFQNLASDLSNWEFDSVLTDGQVVHIRPIRPEDGDELLRFHRNLSMQTVSLRFFSPKKDLTPKEIHRFTNVDYEERMALAGFLDSELVGVARYDRIGGTRLAETAYVIADDIQGRGLGTLLLEHLAAFARELGIEKFIAETLPQNKKMLDVFRAAGFKAQMALEDGVIKVEFPLEPTEASKRAMEQREQVAEAASMAHLMEPATVAIIGAGRNPSGVGHTILRNILDGDFAGTIFPIHKSAASICGIHAYKCFDDLPEDVDLVIIVTPAIEVPKVLEDAARRGAHVALVISAGFAETGGEGEIGEAHLLQVARANGLRLVGPNCLG
ncbi:MAG: GNAT family N-acetyltransferase, partial [Acidimicrobiales bacterium]|nr:GNAT family N-acetyltransferase [Acidimicrobiales bacterium]